MKTTLFLLFVAFASEPCIAKPIGKVSFLATGEGLALDINGEGGIVDAEITRHGNKISGTFEVKLSDFKTGLALRDEHLQKLLEISKFPTAKFKILEMEAVTGVVNGTLELHGRSMVYAWPATFDGSRVSVGGKIKLTDFGITPPEYKVARVSNEVEITVNLAL